MTATAVPGVTGQRGQVTGQAAATVRPPVMAGAVQPRSDTDGVGLTCLVCGEAFVAARRDRRTCSRRCARRDRTARRQAREATEGRTCAGCGGVFFGGRADRRHCDVRCRMRAYRRRRREQRRHPRDGWCPVSVLTPRQRAVLRAYGGWMLADILIDPDQGIAHAKQSHYGTTSYRVDDEEFRMQTTARGIELSRWTDDGSGPFEVLPWSAVARFARTLPARVVAELRARRQEVTRTTRSHPAYPVGASDEEKERWERDTYRPWLARHWDTQAQLEAALDAAILGGAGQPALFTVDARPHQPAAVQSSRPAATSVARVEQDRLL